MDEIIKRIHLLLNHYELSASAFADKIKVQRSSISHLLNGRNKPSLEFIMRVIEHFNTVDFYWLVYGKGSFPKSESSENKASPPLDAAVKRTTIQEPLQTGKKIDRIVVFYNDGTFKTYQQE